MKKNKLEIKITEEYGMFKDKQTKAKILTIPFNLSDGTNAALSVIRLSPKEWNPYEEIKKITIEYQ